MIFSGKNSKILLIIIHFSLLFIILFFLQEKTQAHEAKMDGLKTGDTINYFDIFGEDGELLNLTNLSNKKISMVFIMSQPCHVCQKNKSIWQRIFVLNRKRINTYCIVMDEFSKLIELSESNLFKFPLYCPKDVEKFKELFFIHSRKAQTLLFKKNNVIYNKIGILDIDDYHKIIKMINGE